MITTRDASPRKIAYFSMEVGIGAHIPTYSGGLGVLAGDTIRAAADLKVPMVAVTLLHRKGYFYQRLDANGWQSEEPVEWVVEDFLTEMPPRITVTLAERTVQLRCWKHGEVSQAMFNRYVIDAITNGVHAVTWVSDPFATLYDRYIAGWKQDYFSLRYALGIPKEEIWQAHAEAKRALVNYANREANSGFDDEVLTIGVARRATLYKRTDLLFTDIERLRSIARNAGPFQVIFAGKAHPQDREGKELIQRIFAFRNALRNDIRICYLAQYDMELAKLLTAGADVWLNTPEPPMEASGTSGMKAALNGVPSLSVLDGWWIEGHVEGVTGWSIGSAESEGDQSMDAKDLYLKLERVILPLFYGLPFAYAQVMRSAIALNGSFFNTQRMVEQYVRNAYFPADSELEAPLSAEQAIRR